MFLAQRVGSDFQGWRDQRDWTARKYALHDAGKRLRPNEWEPGKPASIFMRCPCGFNSPALADTVVHVPHLSAVYLWSRVASCLGIAKFYEPIAVPGKRQRLTTIRDAALYITSLPEPERGAEHWRPAATLLRLIGENGGCVVFPGLAVMYGVRKGVQPEPPEPDPSKKTTHWGKRESKRQHLIAPGFRMRV